MFILIFIKKCRIIHSNWGIKLRGWKSSLPVSSPFALILRSSFCLKFFFTNNENVNQFFYFLVLKTLKCHYLGVSYQFNRTIFLTTCYIEQLFSHLPDYPLSNFVEIKLFHIDTSWSIPHSSFIFFIVGVSLIWNILQKKSGCSFIRNWWTRQRGKT